MKHLLHKDCCKYFIGMAIELPSIIATFVKALCLGLFVKTYLLQFTIDLCSLLLIAVAINQFCGVTVDRLGHDVRIYLGLEGVDRYPRLYHETLLAVAVECGSGPIHTSGSFISTTFISSASMSVSEFAKYKFDELIHKCKIIALVFLYCASQEIAFRLCPLLLKIHIVYSAHAFIIYSALFDSIANIYLYRIIAKRNKSYFSSWKISIFQFLHNSISGAFLATVLFDLETTSVSASTFQNILYVTCLHTCCDLIAIIQSQWRFDNYKTVTFIKLKNVMQNWFGKTKWNQVVSANAQFKQEDKREWLEFAAMFYHNFFVTKFMGDDKNAELACRTFCRLDANDIENWMLRKFKTRELPTKDPQYKKVALKKINPHDLREKGT